MYVSKDTIGNQQQKGLQNIILKVTVSVNNDNVVDNES